MPMRSHTERSSTSTSTTTIVKRRLINLSPILSPLNLSSSSSSSSDSCGQILQSVPLIFITRRFFVDKTNSKSRRRKSLSECTLPVSLPLKLSRRNSTDSLLVKTLKMRPRSSRLFFLLLHLLGVSTTVPPSSRCSSSSTIFLAPTLLSSLRKYRPSLLTWSVGIVGVHPSTIYLERLNLESSRRGLQGILERVEKALGWDGDNDLLSMPFWFQDSNDGKCLGPSGFSDCGDTTLWRVRRKPLTNRQIRQRRLNRKNRPQQTKVIENNSSHEQKRQKSSASPVCVWPFFCERDSQLLQRTQHEYDEVFGFEIDDFDSFGGFALELVDHHSYSTKLSLISSERWRRYVKSNYNRIRDRSKSECLVSFSPDHSLLQLGSCNIEEAWVWNVNQHGNLVYGSTKSKRPIKSGWRFSSFKMMDAPEERLLHFPQSGMSGPSCVHRVNKTIAALLPCRHEMKHKVPDKYVSLVGLFLVKYPSAFSRFGQVAPVGNDWIPWITLEGSPTELSEGKVINVNSSFQSSAPTLHKIHMPTSRTNSQNQASVKHHHFEVKSTESMLHAGLLQSVTSIGSNVVRNSASHIHDSFAETGRLSVQEPRTQESSSHPLSSSKLRLEKTTRQVHESSKSFFMHAENPSSSMRHVNNVGDDRGLELSPGRAIRIPVHPYIEASKDGIWLDPSTLLDYPTDICSYLGQTKKEAGRHTLMGVGQYFKTAFNIKVYGAALYVSKRDVLADPKFAKYATLSSEELRHRSDFYEHLMNMPSPGDDLAITPGGFFDRTLMVKTNMQLSTDAMRRSLEADWSLLTDEMKSLIIESSFRERMADKKMLQKILSKENSSRCSCGQIAPPEYNAEPACCGRGTELVFTWRKNGDFEIRLDGRIMDIFPRPDMAKGIFSEYLNENPISLDAKSHFTDGFPFLLAPLAQLKGMPSAVPLVQESSVKFEKQLSKPFSHILDLATNSIDYVTLPVHVLSEWMQDGAVEISAFINAALDGTLEFTNGLKNELNLQCMELVDTIIALHDEGIKVISSLFRMLSDETENTPLVTANHLLPSKSQYLQRFSSNYHENTVFTTPGIIPDEIGIEIKPRMNFSHWLFFTSVHIYFILLLIVSLQGNYSSRFVVKHLNSKNMCFSNCIPFVDEMKKQSV